MPTSNGQVTARDIRQNAVKTLHILNEAVTTAKIPDLAVTFPDKIDDPIWSSAFGPFVETETSITTTSTVKVSETVDVPAWVGAVTAIIFGSLQVSNTSGATQNFRVASFVDSVGGAGTEHSVEHNQTQTLVDITAASLTGVAGSSVLIEVASSTNGGTHSAAAHRVYGFLIGSR